MKRSGFEAWIVGGCVRDALLGRTPDDWDITTSALPEEVFQTLTRSGIAVRKSTGLKHGTVTAFFKTQDGYENYEITTYRSEGDYSDGRHPDSVSFVKSLEADLSRRDFTVNAMASDGETLVDPFDGQTDINNKLLRAVGDPGKRFKEDALRILRGLRFASQLGFEIEEDTLRAMSEFAPHVRTISSERIAVEFDKLLAGQYCYDIIMKYGDMLDVCVGKSRDRSSYCRDTFVDKSDPDALFALYFGENAISAAKDLKMSNERKRAISGYIEAVNTKLPDNRADALRFMRRFPDTVKTLHFCKKYEPDLEIDSALELVNKLRKEDACYDIGSLEITGNDLISLGYSGPAVGKSLEDALEAVICEKVPNEKNALLSYLKEENVKNNVLG